MLITWKTFPSSRTRRDLYIKIYLLKQPQRIMSLNSNMSNNSCEFLHKTFLTLIQNNIFEIHQVINRNIRSLLYKPSSTKKIYKVTTVPLFTVVYFMVSVQMNSKMWLKYVLVILIFIISYTILIWGIGDSP